jgi:hypothetical protein
MLALGAHFAEAIGVHPTYFFDQHRRRQYRVVSTRGRQAKEHNWSPLLSWRDVKHDKESV